MDNRHYDVIIIGAGAAGLIAAWELVQAGRSVAVLEARDRIGGRMHTVNDSRFEQPVERGAEFVHGNLEPTLSLLKKAGIAYYEVKGERWESFEEGLHKQTEDVEDFKVLKKRLDDLEQDITISELLERYFTEPAFKDLRTLLENYVEGYYAADVNKASAFALRDELENADEEQYRIRGGYAGLFNFLQASSKEKGAEFFLSAPVQAIDWQRDRVSIFAGGITFIATKLLVTVPVGVLQQEKITLTPALPEKTAAAKALGYGPVVKIVLQFDARFWEDEDLTGGKNLGKMAFVFSQEAVPTWWSQYPDTAAVLTGWAAGKHAKTLSGLDETIILDKALASLSNIFPNAHVRSRLKGWQIADWLQDPYSCGAYAYEVVGGSALKKTLAAPVEDTLFFAGEGLYEGADFGTVNAALVTGREAAYSMIATFKK